MSPEELRKWADGQVQALIDCGVDPLDAENTVKRVLAKLPEGVDPDTWIPPADNGEVEITEADVEDARANWYASDAVPAKYKRLLDAVEEEES